MTEYVDIDGIMPDTGRVVNVSGQKILDPLGSAVFIWTSWRAARGTGQEQLDRRDLSDFPYLEQDDITQTLQYATQTLQYAADAVRERELPLRSAG